MSRRFHLVWGVPTTLVLVALLLLAAPFLLIRVRGVRDWAVDHAGLSSVLAGRQRLRCQRVSGFSPAGFSLQGLSLETATPSGWLPWLSIGRLSASWNVNDLVSGKISVSNLTVDSLRVELARMPQPWLVSRPERASAPAPSVLRLPPMECASLRLSSFEIVGPGERRLAGDLDLRGVKQKDGLLGGSLIRCRFQERPDSIEVELSRGEVHGRLAEFLQLDSLTVAANGLEARVSGRWNQAAGDSVGAGRVTAEARIARFHPLRLPPLRRLRLPLLAGDSLQGTVHAEGGWSHGASPRGRIALDLSGRIMGQGLDTLFVRGAGSPDSATLGALRLCFGGLRIQGEGRWNRPAARAAAHLHFQGLDLSGGPVALLAPRLPKTLLSGEIEARAEEIGPRLRLIADLRCDPGSILDRSISGFTAKAGLDPERVRIDELRTSDSDPPSLTLSATLQRAQPIVEAQARCSRLALETWIAPWLNLPLQGELTGPLHASGPLRHLRVDGEFGIRKARVEEVLLDSLEVRSIQGSVSPLDLQGSLRAVGCRVYQLPFDSIRGSFHLADTIASALTAWRDTIAYDLQTRVRPAVRGSVWLDSVRVRPGSAPSLELAGPARLDWSPDLVRVDTLRFRSEAGLLSASGWIRPGPGRKGREPFALHLRGEGVRLGSVADFLGLSSQDLDGSIDLSLDGSGSLDSPDVDFGLQTQGMRTFGWLWSHAALAGSVRSNSASAGGRAFPPPSPGVCVRIDSLRATSLGYAGTRVTAERVGPEAPGPPMVLRADSLLLALPQGWKACLAQLGDSSRELLTSAVVGGRIVLDNLSLTPILSPLLAPRIRKGARPSFAQPLDPMIAAIRVVRPVTETERERKASGVGGLVSLKARFSGTGSDPKAEVALGGTNVHVFQAWADSVRFDAAYDRSMLTIRDLDWYMGAARSHTEGKVPLVLSADPRRIRWGPGSWDLTTEIPEIDLSLASLVTSLIQDPRGSISGLVKLAGSPPRLNPQGDLKIKDGSFRVPGREERLSQVRADLHFDSTGVSMNNVAARLNETGQVTAHGTYRDQSHFSFVGSVRDGPVYETGNYRFVVDGDFQAQPVADGDSLRPQVTGNVRVQEGLITIDLAKPPPLSLPAFTPWLIDLTVSAPGNIKVNQPAAVADLGEGDLRVSFRWPYWNLGGQIQIQDGRYRIFNRSFNVTSGKVEFQDRGNGPRPILTVQAETYIPGAAEGERIHVTLNVSGPPEELTVTMSGTSKESSSGGRDYSETELMELMSVGQLSNAQVASFTRSDPTRQYLSSELVAQVERQLVQHLPYADRVQFLWEPGGDAPMRINVQPIVQAQWSLNYAQDLTASPGREVSLHYRLSNLFFINATVDRDSKTGTDAAPIDKYSLDLKYRVEY